MNEQRIKDDEATRQELREALRFKQIDVDDDWRREYKQARRIQSLNEFSHWFLRIALGTFIGNVLTVLYFKIVS